MSEKPFTCDQCPKRFTTAEGVAQHKRDSHGVRIPKIRRKRVVPICPYCGSKSECRDSKVIYHGRSYGPAWICGNYPDCDAYVGCHPGTRRPLGRLANAELRAAKKAAHAAFDPLWQSGGMSRKEAYRWLAGALGLEECHIGEMDVEECGRVVELSKAGSELLTGKG
jgi:ssDNA-binding Zn-finger/Zn-ribbon topoisomerase 1